MILCYPFILSAVIGNPAVDAMPSLPSLTLGIQCSVTSEQSILW